MPSQIINNDQVIDALRTSITQAILTKNIDVEENRTRLNSRLNELQNELLRNGIREIDENFLRYLQRMYVNYFDHLNQFQLSAERDLAIEDYEKLGISQRIVRGLNYSNPNILFDGNDIRRIFPEYLSKDFINKPGVYMLTPSTIINDESEFQTLEDLKSKIEPIVIQNPHTKNINIFVFLNDSKKSHWYLGMVNIDGDRLSGTLYDPLAKPLKNYSTIINNFASVLRSINPAAEIFSETDHQTDSINCLPFCAKRAAIFIRENNGTLSNTLTNIANSYQPRDAVIECIKETCEREKIKQEITANTRTLEEPIMVDLSETSESSSDDFYLANASVGDIKTNQKEDLSSTERTVQSYQDGEVITIEDKDEELSKAKAAFVEECMLGVLPPAPTRIGQKNVANVLKAIVTKGVDHPEVSFHDIQTQIRFDALLAKEYAKNLQALTPGETELKALRNARITVFGMFSNKDDKHKDNKKLLSDEEKHHLLTR